jgi:hypothetical protein
MSRMTEQEYQAYMNRYTTKRKVMEVFFTATREVTPKPKPTSSPTMSNLEARMLEIIEAQAIPKPVQQHMPFKHLGRNHRLDFAWVKAKIALEVNGWVHGTKSKMNADSEKLFLLQREGWFVIIVTKDDIDNGKALARVLTILEDKSEAS